MKTLRSTLSVALLCLIAAPVAATPIILPGDPHLGGQVQGTDFVEGSAGFGPNQWPGAEPPSNAIDGTTNKYLNFGREYTGIIVTPSQGESVINKFKVWTANDEPNRDPINYEIWGSNAPQAHASVAGGSVPLAWFTPVNVGVLNLPDSDPDASRNPGGLPIDDALFYSSSTFANNTSYCTYAIVFPNIRDQPNPANSMQIAELSIEGSLTGGACPVPEPSTALLALAFLPLLALRRR